jgi:hypothetical protein
MGQKSIRICPVIAKGYVYGTPILNIQIHRKFNKMQRRYAN